MRVEKRSANDCDYASPRREPVRASRDGDLTQNSAGEKGGVQSLKGQSHCTWKEEAVMASEEMLKPHPFLAAHAAHLKGRKLERKDSDDPH